MIEEFKEWLAGLRARLRSPAPVVGVLRLDGPVGSFARDRGITLAGHEKAIQRAFAPKRLKAVALLVNSPGGAPAQCSLVAGRIRELAEEKDVPVIAFCEEVAASGGYWLACAGDEIFADASSIIGSIGVIHSGFGFADLIERFGIERRVHATGGRKGMLDPFREEQEDEVGRLRQLHAEVFETFKQHVRDRRGDRLSAPEEVLFTGDVWTGRGAAEVGLVDGLAEMRAEMRRRYGTKVRFRRAAPRRGLLGRFRRGLVVSVDLGDAAAAVEERLAWRRFGA